MLTLRRVIALAAVALVAVIAYELWIAYQTSRDLVRAQSSVTRLQEALEAGDDAARDDAARDLREAAASARSRTDGPWWGAVTLLPVVGDDAEGVRRLSESVDVLASDAMPPLIAATDRLDGVRVDGRIVIDEVRALSETVGQASSALDEASAVVAAQASSGFVSALKGRYERYVSTVGDLARGVGSAETAVDLAPDMLGGDGPRDYLLAFQSNSEIRATGGFFGSWALLRADDGALDLTRQGTGGQFAIPRTSVIEQTDEEERVYSDSQGRFFVNSNFNSDFPRVAEFMNAHWQEAFPRDELDGIISIDVVALSYLLEATGPVTVDGVTLTSDNVVDELLNNIYIREPENEQQDAFFTLAANEVFSAVTDGAPSLLTLGQGLSRAADEGRLLLAPFIDAEREALAGQQILGEFLEAESDMPRVDVTINDVTAAKMSYYLRFATKVDARSCSEGRQRFAGTTTLRQTVRPEEVERLPDYVSGAGRYGARPGAQRVYLRFFGPSGGSIDSMNIDGRMIEVDADEIDGRPAMSLVLVVENLDDLVVSWTATSGDGQTGDGVLHQTPGIASSGAPVRIASAC